MLLKRNYAEMLFHNYSRQLRDVPTGVALVSHGQILRAGPMYQVEVDVAQIKLSQAAEGCFLGPLALVFGTQFTAGRLFSLMKWFQETQAGSHV